MKKRDIEKSSKSPNTTYTKLDGSAIRKDFQNVRKTN
nr:MAG TPA: hypothetical protein [Caudoviricetes sp.]